MKSVKILVAALCLLIFLSIIPPSIALQGPYLPQTINGGPIIDASILGNRELYPGQTASIEVVVQNSGVVQSVIGYETPKPYPVTMSLSVPINTGGGTDSGVDAGAVNNSTSSGNNSTQTTTPTPSPSTDASAVSSAASGASYYPNGETGSGEYSITEQVSPPFDDFELNTGDDVDLAATTALGVTARLSTAGTPIQIVSSDCIDGGSLPSGTVSPPFTYMLRVDRSAKPGVYALPVTITYKHLADQYDFKSLLGGSLCYNNYVQDSVTAYIYVVVREAFDLVITVAGCDNMVPGSDGTVTLNVDNVGGISASESVVYLIPSYPGLPQDGSIPVTSTLIGPNLVLPVQSSQYLGSMGPGDQRTLTFKVAVSPDAEAGTYPLSALVSYTDAWGKQKSSNVDTFGVPVQPEMKFDTDDTPLDIKCGQSCDALINLTNMGSETAYDAVVRMNALDPFVVSYDTVYLGDVKPGDEVNTTFGIKVKPDAVPTTYYVTLEVKYYDSSDDPHVTKIIRKAIIVAPPPTIWDTAMANWPLLAGVGFVGLAGLYYFARGFLKGKRPGKKPPQALLPAPVPEKTQ